MRPLFWLGIFIVAVASVQAQIRTDGTVGPAVALAGPHFQIPDTLGTTRGQNLFHSFQTFNINSGESATFTSLNSVANVFSRVTGGSPSSINGLLKCDIPGANFYFINPAGVLFGPNASVDVQGAFAVTTADYIHFADGSRFDARMPANDVLTVANPVAFGFLTPPQGQTLSGVTFNNCTLQVPAGQTLTVAAGAVDVQNGASVKAPGGTLQVAAVASAGDLPVAGVDTSSFSALGDISLSASSHFSTSASGGGGQFLVRGHDLSLSDNSAIGNNSLDSGFGRASQIDLRGTLSLTSGGNITAASSGSASAGSLSVSAQGIFMDDGIIWGVSGGLGAAADITINAPVVTLQNGSWIDAGTLGQGPGGAIALNVHSLGLFSDSQILGISLGAGQAGNVTIHASDIVLDQGVVSAGAYDVGDGGTVRIYSDTLSLSGPNATARIDTATSGSGHAGNIFITTRELSLDQDAQITAAPLGQAGGDGGDIQIAAHDVTLLNRSGIGSATLAVGNAGDIHLNVSGRCVVDSSYIYADSMSAGAGAAGDVVIQAGDLQVRGAGYIGSSTYGNSAGGNVSITAGSMSLADSSFVAADAASSGKAGDVTVNADTLRLTGNSFLTTESWGSGAAGTMRIQAGQLQIEGAQPLSAGIFSSAAGSGHAGSIEIQAGPVSLYNAQISCSANQGDAGSVTLQSGSSISLDHSYLAVDSAFGNAGTVTLEAPASIVLHRSLVGAFAGLNGGNITIDPQILGLVDSSLNANALTGNGGHISITADFFYQLGDWSITAISYNPSAQPGTVSIVSGVEFANSLSALPGDPLQEGNKIREGCARKNPRANSLIVRGKGGVAARPDAFLPVYDSLLEPMNGL